MWCIAHLLRGNCTTSNPSNLQVVSITGHFTGEPGSLSEFDQAFCGCYQLVINHRPLTSTGGAKLQNQGQPKRYRFLPTQWEWTAWGKTPTSFMWRIKTFKSRYFLKGIKPWSGWNHVQLCPIHMLNVPNHHSFHLISTVILLCLREFQLAWEGHITNRIGNCPFSPGGLASTPDLRFSNIPIIRSNISNSPTPHPQSQSLRS